MTAKIIPFPYQRTVKQPTPDPKVKEALDDLRIREFVEKLTQDMSMDILSVLQDNVVDIKSEEFLRDLAMVVESIKALLYRDFGKKHKHQEITDIITQIIQTKTGQKLTNINYDKLILDYDNFDGTLIPYNSNQILIWTDLLTSA